MPGSRRPIARLPHLFGPKYPRPRNAGEALERLRQGNRHFVQGHLLHSHESNRRREHVAQDGQHPFALIVACSDSREAPEILFDCGLGDLFVVRTAGHVLGNTALGSIEFGVLNLGLRLVLVLGHSHCGAVNAAIQAVQHGTLPTGHIGTLVESIAPCVHAAAQGKGDLAEETMRLHVIQTVGRIRSAEVLRGLPDLLVMGGRYDIATGEVQFMDN